MCIPNKTFTTSSFRLVFTDCGSYVLGAQSELQVKLELEDLDLILRARRLCWFGHMELGHIEHSRDAVKTACDAQVDGKRGRL